MQDSGFLDVPNARLYYEVAGAGPAVVFVHGFTLDARMWDDQWTVFGERYRVVRYDLRGFGRSEAEPVPYSDLDDLLALLNFLDIERAHLVGLSMGGMVLVHFALTHPRRVRGHKPADCGPSGLTGPVDALSDAEELAVAGRMAEALDNWLASPVFVPARERQGVAARLQEIVSDYAWWCCPASATCRTWRTRRRSTRPCSAFWPSCDLRRGGVPLAPRLNDWQVMSGRAAERQPGTVAARCWHARGTVQGTGRARLVCYVPLSLGWTSPRKSPANVSNRQRRVPVTLRRCLGDGRPRMGVPR